jgi:PAS domain S-box-containing protein
MLSKMTLAENPDSSITPPRRADDTSWRTIFDGDPGRVVVLGPTGSVAAVNHAWRLHHGEEAAASPWVGANYFDLLVGTADPLALRIAAGLSELLDGVREQFTLDFASRESADNRWTFLRAYPWVRAGARYAVVRHDDATPLGDAQEQASLMTAVVSEIESAVIVCDLAHRVQQWNAGAEAIYGYRADQARGMRLEHLIAPRGTTAELGLEALDHVGRASHSRVHRRRDGSSVTVTVRVRLLPDRDGRPGFLAVIASPAQPAPALG